MPKRILLSLILFFSAFSMWAERIDVTTAREVAIGVAFQLQGNSNFRSSSDPTLVYVASPGKKESQLRNDVSNGPADFFVFNFSDNQGFVIVSGENSVTPVLAYAKTGSFSGVDLPDNLAAWLSSYQEQIATVVKSQMKPSAAVKNEWKRYLKGEGIQEPSKTVVLETACWGQDGAFNSYVKGFPEKINGTGKVITGCVATAMGIIMHYHKYPLHTTGKGIKSYTVEKNSTPISIDYDEDYIWDNMPFFFQEGVYTNEQAQAVSRLLWHCGVNINMQYGSSNEGGSGAETKDACEALTSVFGYSPSMKYLSRNMYDWDEWKKMIRDEIDAKRPILYAGTKNDSGHQFVCDGYDQNGYFHFNWGWEGLENGFYQLSVLNDLASSQDMVLNIIPNPSGEKYLYEPSFADFAYKEKKITYAPYYLGFGEKDLFHFAVGVINGNNEIVEAKEIKQNVDINFLYDETSTEKKLEFSVDPQSLKEGESLIPVYSRDEKSWQKMRPLIRDTVSTPVIIGVDNKEQPIYKKNDSPNDPEKQLPWAQLIENEFNSISYLPKLPDFEEASLNNSDVNFKNTWSIVYKFPSDVKLSIRYTIDNYAKWKDHLKIYNGTSDIIGNVGEGTLQTVDENGQFIRTVSNPDPSANSENFFFEDYYKLLADCSGEFSYSMEVFSETNPDVPSLVSKDNKLYFVEPVKGVFSERPIRGMIKKEIPFSYELRNVDPLFIGQDFYLNIEFRDVYAEDLTLYDLTNNKIVQLKDDSEEEEEPENPENNSAGGTADNPKESGEKPTCSARIYMGKFEANKSYPFKMISNWPSNYESSIISNTRVNFTPTLVNKKELPSFDHETIVIFDEKEVTTYIVSVNSDTIRLKSDNFGSTSIHLGENNIVKGEFFRGFLECVSKDYMLPLGIKVTMGDSIISTSRYTYDNTTGEVGIANLIGNVVISPIDSTIIEGGTIDNPKVVNPEDIGVKEQSIRIRKVVDINLNNDLSLYELINEPGAQLTFKNAKPGVSVKIDQIENQGTLVDETGLIREVKGNAALAILSSWKNEINVIDGSSVTLMAEIQVGSTYQVTFTWEKKMSDGTWKPVGEPQVVQPVSMLSLLRSEGSVNTTISVPSDQEGLYRCTMKNEVGGVSTTLCAFVKVNKVAAPEPEPSYYWVTIPEVEGVTTSPQPGLYVVIEQGSFSFSLSLDPEYDQSIPVVKVGGVILQPDVNGNYNLTYILEDKVISIEGVKKNETTSNAEVNAEAVCVRSTKGKLYIQTLKPVKGRILNFSGQLVKDIQLPEGESVIELPAGMYIIYIEGRSYKARIM